MDEVNTLAAPLIEARALEKFYTQPDGGRVQVISPTNLAIYPGQILTLPGPSGCGKSTLPRMLTGLAEPSAGQVLWLGRRMNGDRPDVAIVNRLVWHRLYRLASTRFKLES